MVRSYVLTDREKEIIRVYLDQGLKLDGYRELKHYVGQLDVSQIEGDLELIKRFKEKAEG